MSAADVLVVGGGLVGAAVAWGLAREGACVTVLDEGDVAYRASRGNFGLVWVQSKGARMPEYAQWTRRSADLWPGFADELADVTGISPDYRKPGGLHLFLTEREWQEQADLARWMHNVHGPDYGMRMVDRQELLQMMPQVGPEVIGASYSPHDGHASPLLLLRALHAGLKSRGGRYVSGAAAESVARDGDGFAVDTPTGTFRGSKLVLAAGLGNARLGPMVGLNVPVQPNKGQILVTERTSQILHMPTHVVRQTEEGAIMMGDSHEDMGLDTRSSPPIMAEIAARAVRVFPFLSKLRVLRAWAALRVMSPDGHPIYDQSGSHPGAFAVNCHSGVTLAGAHALALAPMIVRGRLDDGHAAFSAGRFDVQTD